LSLTFLVHPPVRCVIARWWRGISAASRMNQFTGGARNWRTMQEDVQASASSGLHGLKRICALVFDGKRRWRSRSAKSVQGDGGARGQSVEAADGIRLAAFVSLSRSSMAGYRVIEGPGAGPWVEFFLPSSRAFLLRPNEGPQRLRGQTSISTQNFSSGTAGCCSRFIDRARPRNDQRRPSAAGRYVFGAEYGSPDVAAYPIRAGRTSGLARNVLSVANPAKSTALGSGHQGGGKYERS